MNNIYYEQRFIKNSKDATEIQTIECKNKTKLADVLLKDGRIVLLGNPGIGKSTELNMLFENLWENREDSMNFPLIINLKSFRPVSRFEDLIPLKEWKELPKMTFILDGLDEIADIQDFVSELENFLNKNDDKIINVVLSCRTNIYEKYLINISGFKYYFLDGLTDKQINNILEKRIFTKLGIEELDKFRVYLETPFNLEPFCEYYESKKAFPETQEECWNLFIENELRKLSKDKLKKRENVDIAHVKKCLEKVALVSESMHQNYISDDHVYSLLGKDDKSIFEQISLVEKLPKTDNFVFRHRNYQEFFSAKLLSEFTPDEIISLIRIHPEENITKPSFFNTITFLLNIIEPKKFIELEKWFLANEPEILFLAEKDKLPVSTQKEIFKKYFQEISVEKTFWFGKDRRFSIDKIAEFADIDFLLGIVRENNHFRSVISALDVLSFTKNTGKELEIKQIFTDYIFAGDRYMEVALRSFRGKGFHKFDKELFLSISEHFKNDFSPEINHQLIAMIADFEFVDEYFSVLKNCVDKLYEVRPEQIKDNTIRGTKWLLEKIFLKIENAENFLSVLDVIFNEKFDIKISDFYDKKFRDKLIERILYFSEKETDFLLRCIDAFLRHEDSFIYRRDSIIVDVINRSSKDFRAFKYIINKYGLSDKNYMFLSFFDNKQCIDYLVEKYENKEIFIEKETDLDFLRYKYFYTNYELGYYYEKLFKDAGYKFPEDLPTEKEIMLENKRKKEFVQSNFDILFDREELAAEVSKVFDNNSIIDMTWKNIHEIEWEWYKNKNEHGVQHSVFRAISASVKNSEKKTKEDVIAHISNDYFIIFQIKNKIKDRENEGFTVKEDQISYIKQLCKKFADEFNFNRVINVKSDGNLGIYNGYSILKLLFYFDKKYDIQYSTDFYLRSLKYCNIFGSAEGNTDFIKSRISNPDLFKNQLIENLKKEVLDSGSLKDHIDQAIELKLEETYPILEDNFLNDNYIYSQRDFLSRYTELLNKDQEITFLEKCCNNIDSYLCWKAVEVFIEKKLHSTFILEIARKHLEKENPKFVSDALNVLFYCNDESALPLYLKFLIDFKNTERVDYRDDYRIKDFANYKRLDSILVLKDIFKIVYDENVKDTFDFYNSQNLLKVLINNLSETEVGYKKVRAMLTNLKSEIMNNDNKFFYVNNLIEDSKLSYYASISRPFTFKEAKIFLEEIESI